MFHSYDDAIASAKKHLHSNASTANILSTLRELINYHLAKTDQEAKITIESVLGPIESLTTTYHDSNWELLKQKLEPLGEALKRLYAQYGSPLYAPLKTFIALVDSAIEKHQPSSFAIKDARVDAYTEAMQYYFTEMYENPSLHSAISATAALITHASKISEAEAEIQIHFANIKNAAALKEKFPSIGALAKFLEELHHSLTMQNFASVYSIRHSKLAPYIEELRKHLPSERECEIHRRAEKYRLALITENMELQIKVRRLEKILNNNTQRRLSEASDGLEEILRVRSSSTESLLHARLIAAKSTIVEQRPLSAPATQDLPDASLTEAPSIPYLTRKKW